MSHRLLISALPGEMRAAWLREGRLERLSIVRADRPSLVGNIYLGRVCAVDRALDAAFVEIGLARPAFLPLKRAPEGVAEGRAVVVSVVREPGADKGARVSARPGDIPVGVAEAAEGRAPPALIRSAEDPLVRALSTQDDLDEILIDDAAYHARARKALSAHPELNTRLAFDPGPDPLFEREGIEEMIEALLTPAVALPSGGRLLIEPVETLTAIDVDSARDTRPALSIDLEAAVEIPRQIRLRNLSGLIVIDCLGLADSAARKRVIDVLREGFRDDEQPVQIEAMRPSGLVELTRQRRGRPVHEVLSIPCGIGGSGRVKDVVTLGYEALRAARAAGARQPGRRLAIAAMPALASALDGPVLAAARHDVESRLGLPLTCVSEPGREGFEILPLSV